MSDQPPAREIAWRFVSTRTVARLVLVVLLTTLTFLLALWLLYQLQTIVVWSILALFLAVALRPVVDWMTRRRAPRAIAILLAYLVLLFVVAAVGALVAPSLFRQVSDLVHALQQPGGLTGRLDRLVHDGDGEHAQHAHRLAERRRAYLLLPP